MSEPSPLSTTRTASSGWMAGLVLFTLLAAVVATWTQGLESPPRPAVTSLQTPRVSIERCAECHSDITETFPLAPHSRTLVRADEPSVSSHFAGRSFHREETGVDYQYSIRDGQLVVSSPAYGRDMRTSWIFGSGTHAQTPLLTWTNESGEVSGVEHVVSWYPHGDQLGVTLGMNALDATHGIHALGTPREPAEVINCFGCHSTYVPVKDGHLNLQEVHPGISCDRCHWDPQTHVQEMDAGEPATIERFSHLSPREAVERCGECHRRASEMGGEIIADDPTLVRFAPVGLVQSPCFVHQDDVVLESGTRARLDCATCHDPHRPAETDWRYYAQTCLRCHDAAHQRAADCTVATREDNCLECHMPKVPMNDHLKFTDHWIRVRTEKTASRPSR